MKYRDMPISEGLKYPGFIWCVVVELSLIIAAYFFLVREDYLTMFIVLILIELRDISITIKAT